MFSQWAVFTELQRADVYSINIFGNSCYRVTKKTEASFDYDLNFISAKDASAWNLNSNKKIDIFYPFFTVGYFYKPVKDFKAGVIITNKGMNLDLSYPTLYLYKYPYFGLTVSKGI